MKLKNKVKRVNKREAFKDAKAKFPELKPTRASGFTLTEDGKGVLIAGYEEHVVTVIHNETDLYRLRSMCDLALKWKKVIK
jgi:hypothetical protein